MSGYERLAPFASSTRLTVAAFFLTAALVLPSCAAAPAAAVEPAGEPTQQESPRPVQCEVTPDGFIEKSYEWTYWRFDDLVWTWSTRIPAVLYEEYAARPRPQTRNYTVYATDERDATIIEDLAHALEQYASTLDLTEQETIHFISTFVQQLAYTSDSETTGFDDYARYPLETLVEEGGDCEDTSILLGKVLTVLGYDVVMVRLPAHMALGVAEGPGFCGTFYPYHDEKYFYLETTGEGGRIGIVPEEYEGQAAYIFAFTPQPVVSHHWTGRRGRSVYELHVTVENEGTAASSGLSILAGFDAGDGKLWNTVETDSFDLAPGETIEQDMTLTLPSEKHTRVRVFIVCDSKSVDRSQSAWFDE